MHRLIAWGHVNLIRAGAGLRAAADARLRTAADARLRAERGQGTVEYVALILLVALVMAGVVAALKGFKTGQGKDLGDAIIGKIKDAVGKVQF
jgi:Flp pilus assembly pilin Flp